ncbi:MAG: TldD/PmbA family protein [Acholeplasmataceae bacterium]
MFEKWLELGLSKGISDLEIFATQSRSLKLSLYQSKLDQNVLSDVSSVSIRGIYDGKLSRVHFENLSDDNAASYLDALIENAKALTVKEPAIIYEGSKSYPEVDDELFDFASVPMIDKIELIKTLESKILENEFVSQVQSTIYQESYSKTVLVNSKGLNLERENTFAYCYSIGVFQKDDDIKTAAEIKIAKKFSDFNAIELAEKTIKTGVSKLGGQSIKSGSYPVVFKNEMFSDILSGYLTVFTGESAYRDLSQLKGKVGEEIAVPELNLIDDPLTDLALFKTPFDDEGVACAKKYLIENGVFKGFMHNLKTAAIFNEEPTGHAFRGGIGPTNIYVEPSDISFDEMIKDIKEGVFITDLVGLHAGVNAVSGEFSAQAGGFKIKDGKIDHPIKMIVVSGNFFKMIKAIKSFDNELEFSTSSIGSPNVYIESLMIGGE